MEEDLSLFLADFGKPCKAGPTDFVGLLDQPDQILSGTYASAHSRQYSLVYATSSVALKRDQPVTVDLVAYRTREAPQQIGDGAFSSVLLTKE